jgi:aspartyl-tRNA synthetase
MQKLDIEEGDLVLFAAGQWLQRLRASSARIRLVSAAVLKAQRHAEPRPPTGSTSCGWSTSRCCAATRKMNRWYSSHHPFTAPGRRGRAPARPATPTKVRGQHYDIVRQRRRTRRRLHPHPSTRPSRRRVFEDILQDSAGPRETSRGSATCSRPSRYGAPPHGGIALASTAWSPCSPAALQSATSSPSRRTRTDAT